MSGWIDFKKLREQLDFAAVLRHYGVELKVKGDQHHGFCPVPTHKGKRNSQSFSANLKRGIFQCFGCGAKGNVLEFAALMDGVDPKDGSALRGVATKLQQRFCVAISAKPTASSKVSAPEKAPSTADKPIIINAPLDFELKSLDREHPYLRTRKFSDATIDEFELGFCSKGYLKDRIAIPLHDQQRRLVGYAGRIVDDALITDEEPRYKFPGQRTRETVIHDFRKSEFLYGGYRIKEPVSDLIVVEGFTHHWWLWQHNIRNVVCLMGWSMSEAQATLIVSLTQSDGRVWLMPDGDESGIRCAQTALPLIAPYRSVRWVKLGEKKQPTDYDGAELRRLLNR
jgi:DNA primase